VTNPLGRTGLAARLVAKSAVYLGWLIVPNSPCCWISLAMSAVQPVWWEAPRPAPLSAIEVFMKPIQLGISCGIKGTIGSAQKRPFTFLVAKPELGLWRSCSARYRRPIQLWEASKGRDVSVALNTIKLRTRAAFPSFPFCPTRACGQGGTLGAFAWGPDWGRHREQDAGGGLLCSSAL
jgi:hypothetical protein